MMTSGVDGHDDRGNPLRQKVQGAVMSTHYQSVCANAFTISHYQTPNSFKPNTTVSARLTPKTIPADFLADSLSLPKCRSRAR